MATNDTFREDDAQNQDLRSPQGCDKGLRCLVCGASHAQEDIFCTNCGVQLDVQTYGVKSSEPPRSFMGVARCPVCEKKWIEGDRYCRYCGAKKYAPKYITIEESFACVYGPMPKLRKHICIGCGYTWKTGSMIDNESFCPECGGMALSMPSSN